MRHGSDCKQLGCFSLINPQESVEDPGSQLRTTGCFGPVNPEESAGTLELIANNGVVIHIQGFSYLMRLEAECFALSLRDLRN